MPKFSMEEEKHARFDREGCALVLLNGNDVVVFDTMRKEIKWRLEMKEEVLKVFWTSYPNQFAAVMHEEIVIINVYWRYMVLKKWFFVSILYAVDLIILIIVMILLIHLIHFKPL